MTYYQKLINTIKENIEDNKILEAKKMVDEELSMPYIPKDVEEELYELKQTVESLLKLNEDEKHVSIAKIEEYLQGDEKMQLQAVAALFEKNLRLHTDLIAKYLINKPFKDAASLLIDALIDQQINYEFTYLKDDLEYVFIPLYLKKPYETEGFIEADKYLTDWLANDNPSVYEMCLQVLIRHVYLLLPLETETHEAKNLALSIAEYVYKLMDDIDAFKILVKKYELDDISLINIEG